jgi:putative hydrolase of the HAD superfamily
MPENKWIGFDLDGTLHDIVRIRKIGDTAVFTEVTKHCGHPVDVLAETYRHVNASHLTQDFFVNGMSANENRTLRYKTLLDCISVPDNGLVQQCIDIFYETFDNYAELFPGVTDLLQRLKDDHYQIAIITERPHDSAEHALDSLGLTPYVDLLMTTGGERLTKPDGLFLRALEHMKTDAAGTTFVGDRIDRDIRPALAAGMKAIWYLQPDLPREKIPEDLKKLTTLISDHQDVLKLI